MGHGVKFSTTSRGPGLVATLLRIRKEVKESSVKVGVFGQAKHQNGKNDSKWNIGMVELAVIHEYGAPKAHIPARSFLGSTINVNHKEYVHLVGELLVHVYEGKLTVARALNLLGMRVASDVKGRIERGQIKQDLAPSTIAAKLAKGKWKHGEAPQPSPKALIDTGRLKESITWQVEAHGSGGSGGHE